MLEQLALTPNLSARLQAGGVVGKVILEALAIGLIIALVRGVSLAIARQKIRAQLKNPEQAGDTRPCSCRVQQRTKPKRLEALGTTSF